FDGFLKLVPHTLAQPLFVTLDYQWLVRFRGFELDCMRGTVQSSLLDGQLDDLDQIDFGFLQRELAALQSRHVQQVIREPAEVFELPAEFARHLSYFLISG